MVFKSLIKTHQIHGHLEGGWGCDNPRVLGDSTEAKGSKGDTAAPMSQTVAKEVCGSVDEEVNCDGKKKPCGTSSVVVSNILYVHPYLREDFQFD